MQECTDNEVTVDDFMEVGPRLMLLAVQKHPPADQRHLPEETRGVLQVCYFVHDRNHQRPRLKFRPVNSRTLLPGPPSRTQRFTPSRGECKRYPLSISFLSRSSSSSSSEGLRHVFEIREPNVLVKRWTMSTKTEKSRVLDASMMALKYELPSGMKNTTFGDGGRSHSFHFLHPEP